MYFAFSGKDSDKTLNERSSNLKGGSRWRSEAELMALEHWRESDWLVIAYYNGKEFVPMSECCKNGKGWVEYSDVTEESTQNERTIIRRVM